VLGPIEIRGFCSSKKRQKEKENLSCRSGCVTSHLPMRTGPNSTYPSGMVLHIKSYALHGLIRHRDHSNVNHISSSILLNICIKSLIHQSIAQRHYKNLQYKIGEKDKASYWASVHKKRNVSRKISSKPCK
jgi:hypothetical protein